MQIPNALQVYDKVGAILKQENFNIREAKVILALSREKTTTSSEIMQIYRDFKSSMYSTAFNSLEKKGYLIRAALSQNDRRKPEIELTEIGEKKQKGLIKRLLSV